MTWTTRKPTQPGWYWVRKFGEEPDVDFVGQDKYGGLWLGIFNLRYYGSQWEWSSEPIKEPEEQKELG